MAASPDEHTRLSLSTFLALAPLLGASLEDRSSVRLQQDETLSFQLLQSSGVRLPPSVERRRLVLASFDVLVEQHPGRTRFFPVELNGTGVGGLTNCHPALLRLVERSLDEHVVGPSAPLTWLVPYASSRPSAQLNHLFHERALLAQALVDRLVAEHGRGRVSTARQLLDGSRIDPNEPLVVLAAGAPLLSQVHVVDGALLLGSRRLDAVLHDSVWARLDAALGGQLGVGALAPLNDLDPVTTSKAAMYAVWNQLVADGVDAAFPPLSHRTCADLPELESVVTAALEAGQPVVVKPLACGLSRGIDFFLDRRELPTVGARLAASVASAAELHDGHGEFAFPYTVCEWVDATPIRAPAHALDGHKFELRCFVVRDGDTVRTLPAVAKVSSQRYDRDQLERAMLLNTVGVSRELSGRSGGEHLLALTAPSTLALLGLTPDQLAQLAAFASRFVVEALARTGARHPWPAGS